MLTKLKTHFPNCTNGSCRCSVRVPYIQTRKRKVYLYDNPDELTQPVQIVNSSSHYQIIINNVRGKRLTLGKLDACLFGPADVSRCDCFLFSMEKFYFIEIKDVSVKNRANSKADAVSQLESMINHFFAVNVDFKGKELNAVIGLKTVRPYIVKPSFLSHTVRFKQNYNVNLQEGSQIDF